MARKFARISRKVAKKAKTQSCIPKLLIEQVLIPSPQSGEGGSQPGETGEVQIKKRRPSPPF